MGLIKTLSGQFAKIKVIGIGGGGNNAINSMIDTDNISGVDFIAINTDSQALLNSRSPIKIQIGEKLTKGLGSGGNPQTGQQAAEESQDRIREILQDTDMVFLTGGMGGGTCTGATPVIAKIAKKEFNILTIATVTKPFLFEGTRRMSNALEGISRLKEYVDTLIIIPNQKIMEVVNSKATILEAFKIADSVLSRGTKAIADLITKPGLINLDFADIKSVMSNAGSALMGVGEAKGENRAQKAVKKAIESPLIEVDINGARGILLNITGGPDLTMAEIEESAKTITQYAAPDANVIFGTNIEEELKGSIKITLIATGFSPDQSSTFTRLTKTSPPKNSSKKISPSLPQKLLKPLKTTHSKKIKKILGDQPIPEGLDIVDELDIPTFLRKK